MSNRPNNLIQANTYQKKYLTEQQRISIRVFIRSALSDVEVDIFLRFVRSCQDISEFLHGGWHKVDVALLTLYWMGKHEVARSRDMKRQFGIPRCTFFKCVEKLMVGVELFNKQHIVWGSIGERKQIAQKTMPPDYNHCTGIIDGVHIHIKVSSVLKLFLYY